MKDFYHPEFKFNFLKIRMLTHYLQGLQIAQFYRHLYVHPESSLGPTLDSTCGVGGGRWGVKNSCIYQSLENSTILMFL